MMACVVFLLIFGPTAVAGDTQDVPRISVHQAKKMMGSPDTIVIDVRKYRNWWRSSKKIPTAVREDPSKVNQWIEKYAKSQTLIFYCSWKHERTSARVARSFLLKGYKNVFALQGGWSAWMNAGYPVEEKWDLKSKKWGKFRPRHLAWKNTCDPLTVVGLHENWIRVW